MTMTGPGVRTERRGDAGFTLLEVLLAMAILAFVTATLFGTFSQTSRVKKRIEAAQERTHVVRVALMRMTREIEMAFLSDSENPFTPERRTMFVGSGGGEIGELRFSWFGHQRLRAEGAEADSSVVVYYGEADRDQPGIINLMRRETRRLEVGDPRELPGESYVLCPDVRRLSFSFYDFKKKEWREDWTTIGADGFQYLPTHVRINLTVLDERGQEVTYFSAARIQMTERVAYRPVKS
jgi:general secretion pathway protein J